MEAGTIGSWAVKEGDSFEAGDVIAEVETDKATMGFEAQDPGVVAKILIEAGTEVPVGSPILIIVDDADSPSELVNAFADFVLPATPAAAPVPEAPPTPPVETVATPVEAPPAPVMAPAPAPAPVVAPVVEVAPVVVPVAEVPQPTQASSLSWGQMAKNSALAFKLGKDQKSYIEKYGSTGQLPIS
eukprot:CAMPEP_0114345056 /NCGR_PEP_ID=MMETSP0101-20121206/11909_1 /TAXON_ID=38822 ORGANISM="Pteridomonas danica, Strain PT" /NCGR_SAMPLE_ID=MMETSP0101 /ASSEMBLY_ACC=CAM_ASM_000211 /LENGTH=185 /DNA_ID=CAMNT_0001480765 /DNA_START=116 /DNA_END=673 /DNA_ORIENTATION=+